MTSTKLASEEVACAELVQRCRLAPGIPTAWLPLSYVMAHIEIESGFDPAVKAADFASTGSIGLMQVTRTTAAETIAAFPAAGLGGPQTDPYTSICTGMLYLATCRDYLLPIFRAPLSYAHVCVAYNAGPGNAGRLSLHQALGNRYYFKWRSAQARFAMLDSMPIAVAA